MSNYLVNGASLNRLAWNLSIDEGLQETPELLDRAIDVIGMHGQFDPHASAVAPPRVSGPGKIAFSGWVKGVDPLTGKWTESNTLDLYYARVDELIGMFRRRNLVLDHVRADGTRRAVGYRLGVMRPALTRTAPRFGQWTVTVKIPSAFWSSIVDVTTATPGGGVATGGTIPLGGLAVGNAPIVDARALFGPGSNPSLFQDGTLWAYDGVIASGRTLLIDMLTRTCTAGPGAAWTPDDWRVRWGPGSASWFEIDPSGSPITLGHTGGGVMSCSITAYPKWETS